MNATDKGNSDEIIKCLNLDNTKIVKNDTAPTKRLDRLFSTRSMEGDLKDDVEDEDRKKQLDNIIASKQVEEVEEVVFECLNCGS